MKNLIARKSAPVAFGWQRNLIEELHAQGHRAHQACAVIARTSHIAGYLKEHDPKALEQVEAILADDVSGTPPES